MTLTPDPRSGKSAGDENFPVASRLVAARHRPAIMAFYDFARTADDIADHEALPSADKLRRLETLRATLVGEGDGAPVAVALRQVLAERGLPATHALDLLVAFRQDAETSRYATWDDLMTYCRYSAAPVGRMVLAIHGEPAETWAASDALCAALQVINHLQDCGEDYWRLDRVYLPLAELKDAGVEVAALAAPRASPGLRAVIVAMAQRTAALLQRSRPLADQVRDRRLRLEVAVIQRLAEDLTRRLIARDPLSERVHHRKLELVGLAGSALLRAAWPAPRANPRSATIAE
ncbi:MAG TPA: squalene synthase HpnC [Phenylobacterium sp.]|jgi:squalene synthase HpnC|uniref:squalene synthase HpnC n=1 Tax=Phenylobacterium sp. TaxID=1871053 RepID=UPI002BD31952|nr:squalene synthase HpnC [Phenylobacterium sp.]HXA40590.1 squalene synthase HpnC [Phenylobacterium sp.]